MTTRYAYSDPRTAIDQSLSPINWVLDSDRYTTKKIISPRGPVFEASRNPEPDMVPEESALVIPDKLTKIVSPEVTKAQNSTNSFLGVQKNLSNALDVKNTRIDERKQVFYSFDEDGKTVYKRDIDKMFTDGDNVFGPKDYIVRPLVPSGEGVVRSTSRASAKTQELSKILEPTEQRGGINTRQIYKK